MYPSSEYSKCRNFPQFLSVPLMALCFAVGLVSAPASAQDIEAFMAASGEWIEARQRPDGSFPLSEGDPDFFASIQSPAALGVLGAWVATGDQDFLDSAVAAGDFLINNFDEFPSNEPRIRTFDPLFFIRLSEETGDPQYANFIQANFWDRLAAGTYGPTGDWDINDYVASELARRASIGEVIAAWDLALIAAAANEDGITMFNSALASGAAMALESAPDTSYSLGTEGFDILGLAGAIWIAGITGESVTPTSGRWAGLPTFTMAARLIDHQSADGGFLQSTQAFTDPVDPVQTVSQVTSFAVLALDALDDTDFFDEITAGLGALATTFQEPSGRINYYHPGVDLSTVDDPKPFVYLSGYALYSVEESRDPDPGPIPVPFLNPWGLALLILLLGALSGLALTLRR
jgi:hypothetical protein